MQNLFPVGLGPSSKIWPWWPPQFLQWYSVLGYPKWLSFFESLPNVFETKTDHLLGYARTEYNCKNCGGHHGHIFEDGPNPTGKRYCNNGICLVFKPINS